MNRPLKDESRDRKGSNSKQIEQPRLDSTDKSGAGGRIVRLRLVHMEWGREDLAGKKARQSWIRMALWKQ